jgi:hypothetical protein
MYAIVEVSNAPTIWQEDQQDRPRRFSISRAVSVEAGQSYNDQWYWIQNGTNERKPILSSLYDAEEVGWQAYEDQSTYANYLEPFSVTAKGFAIIEIVMWGGTENRDLAQIAAVSVDIINDDAFTVPGCSSIRQHVERMPLSMIVPNEFASAYHAMWGLSESLNRCMYEDRNHNTWPVWGDVAGGGA